MVTPDHDVSKPSLEAEPELSPLEAARQEAWADATEARRAAEADPEAIRGFLGLPAGTSTQLVARIAENSALSERLGREAGYAAVRVEHLRRNCGAAPRPEEPEKASHDSHLPKGPGIVNGTSGDGAGPSETAEPVYIWTQPQAEGGVE